MVELFNSAIQIDPITVGEILRREGSLETVGGVPALTDLTRGLPYFSSLAEYIRIVKETALSRTIIRLSNNFVSTALSGDIMGDDLIEHCENAIYRLNGHATSGFSRVQDLTRISIERARLTCDTGQRVIGLPSGLTDLDAMTLGFHPQDLIIVASRPSMGKTALALNIAQNVSLRGNGVVAFFSLEMGKEQLIERIICSECGINSHSYRTGRLDEEEWARVAEYENRLAESRFYIDDTPAITISYARAKLRRLVHEQHQVDLIVFDYLQLMTGRTTESREREVSQISRDLKSLAKEFEVPVIATSQLNRGPETRSNHLPTMSDVRESGGIEQDADLLMGLYREDYYIQDPSAYTNIAQVLVLKQRNGPTGTVNLQFTANNSSFRNLAPVDF